MHCDWSSGCSEISSRLGDHREIDVVGDEADDREELVDEEAVDDRHHQHRNRLLGLTDDDYHRRTEVPEAINYVKRGCSPSPERRPCPSPGASPCASPCPSPGPAASRGPASPARQLDRRRALPPLPPLAPLAPPLPPLAAVKTERPPAAPVTLLPPAAIKARRLNPFSIESLLSRRSPSPRPV
ncbi:hypothetical protein FOCC_FOCC009288 [Frankliniella occidentalis]|nr:hypothetical protein FOCC_FOCC009288 [Frankliniella occidentalis]